MTTNKKSDAEDNLDITGAEAIAISEKFLLGDLLKAIVAPVKAMSFAWGSLPEADQQKFIDSLTQEVTKAVRETVKLIASGNRPHLKAELESVTFKDGIKAVMQVAKSSADRHDLADATGGTVLIVLLDTGKYLGGEMPRPDADQPNLI